MSEMYDGARPCVALFLEN